ncbi:MAG: tetratricopeptide repeat protein [Pseudomonadota bacterium]|nr:tetratricopeptide repeat protein [Pseudomonadota bacterium]
MDDLLTDDQEVDRAKNWLRENGLFLALSLLIGIGSFFGWQQFQNNKLENSGKASAIWEKMQAAFDGERVNEASDLLVMLESDYSDTPYLDQARLAFARMYMDRNEPDKAADQLRLLSQLNGNQQIQRIAELRLAQVLLYQENYNEVIDLLINFEDSAYAAQYFELRGDAYFYLGKFDDARTSYQRALESDVAGVINQEFVGFKLTSLEYPETIKSSFEQIESKVDISEKKEPSKDILESIN